MALATKDDLKAMLNIQHAQDDALLDRLLASASEYFERQAGRVILAADYTDVQDGTGATSIVPVEYPVVSVTSLTINGETITESVSYDEDGWFLRGDVVRLRGYTATEGTGNVELVYRAGYETTPPDVVQAVLEIAALMYRERERVGQQSRSGPDGNTVFYYAPPARVVSTIEAYRRIA
jgi:uncharacterized phiE125 gp8 family phage protein